jgi:hypothetical protein
MEKQIVDVDYEDGLTCIAKILKDMGTDCEVAILEYYGDGEWNFNKEETDIISKDSISGFYDTTKLEDTGLYEKLKNGMYTEIDNSDFEYEVASSEDDESESDVSLVDEEYL